VDSQSFPLVVPGYETIASNGAYSSEEVYTPFQIADVVKYANKVNRSLHPGYRAVLLTSKLQRGIDVIAEIDTPGHTSAISKAFPEYIACPEASWILYANEPPAGQLRIASPDTVNFTAGLLVNAAKLFPGNYFGTGGDEINLKCYTDDPETQKALAASGKTLGQALDDFTQAEHKALRSVGKTAVVWEEMVLEHQVTLANDTVVM
jgi:hexosaminidase